MRRYETTYILRSNLGETLLTEVIDRTNAIIENDGGTIISLDRWGVKNLAYEIKKENLGYYIYFDFAAPGTTVLEMERIFRLDDNVLRFLTIKLSDSIDQETIDAETELAAAAVIAQQEETAAQSADSESTEQETKKETPEETQTEEVAEKDTKEAETVDTTETESKEETETIEVVETEEIPSVEEPTEEASEKDKE